MEAPSGILIAAAALTLTGTLFGLALAGGKTPDPEQDREAILEHIHGIFQAYLRQDRETLRRTHTKDWVGFLGPSVGIERGIEAYMKNAESSLELLQGTGYELRDTEVQIHGDIALVYYVADYHFRHKETGKEGSLPLRSLDVYRREAGGWNQAGSHITPIRSKPAWLADDAEE